jgi:DNA-binding transcriptional MerR regulator
MEPTARIRIGELSRRLGVTPAALRAWEERYGLPAPMRTAGGYRLYAADDEERVRRMLAHLEEGMPASEAARLAKLERAEALPGRPIHVAAADIDALAASLGSFDDLAAHAVFDQLVGSRPLPDVLRDTVLPYLHELGDRWERGEVTVAHEHFASLLLRGRLLALARGWGSGAGPRAVLACVPGEQHDLGLLCFGLALRAQGWRITYLGPDMPLDLLAGVAADLHPALVVLVAVLTTELVVEPEGLRAVADAAPLALAGAGADAELAASVGARHLPQDPVGAAETVAAEALTRRR